MSSLRQLVMFLGALPSMSAPLTFPTSIDAESGAINLNITPATIQIGNVSVTTYSYNGNVPGPTIRISPGAALSVAITNNMVSFIENCSATNTWLLGAIHLCKAATTNFHAHGVHVSGRGLADGVDPPSDDVATAIQPDGGKQNFLIQIPANHMGGTHWYHPHFHHAVSLQLGGGMLGMLIVEDPPGYLGGKDSVLVRASSAEREKILVLAWHNFGLQQLIAKAAEAKYLQTAKEDLLAGGQKSNVMLVNGQVKPELEIVSGDWYRLRLLYTAVSSNIHAELRATSTASCEWKLIAKDGVYLNDLPRVVTSLYLFAGARNDVLLRCSCSSAPCAASIHYTTRDYSPLENDNNSAGVALDLSIVSGVPVSAGELPSCVQLARPCYLVDLSALPPSAYSVAGEVGMRFENKTMEMTWDGVPSSMKHQDFTAVGGSWRDWAPLAKLTVGSVHEIAVAGAYGSHPFHTHVNPFQVMSVPPGSGASGWLKAGDWHDTILVDSDMTGHNATFSIRMQTDRFTGKQVVHCHALLHEDMGMMGYFDITGKEGMQWEGRTRADATCYDDSFDKLYWDLRKTTACDLEAAEMEDLSAATTAAQIWLLAFGYSLLAFGCLI
eukprot:TRINITY_DN12725_c0_g1_i3.p1 TRINITY_DN12725_c0_g1~~TRINITY_DN12725_c0_g1_i3.p1  ORF type:complete len:610 (-),score=105.37 TRINITY_DN12725_c0_g1_i3:194-2023(-)